MTELKVFSQLAAKGLSGAEVHISMRGSRHNRKVWEAKQSGTFTAHAQEDGVTRSLHAVTERPGDITRHR